MPKKRTSQEARKKQSAKAKPRTTSRSKKRSKAPRLSRPTKLPRAFCPANRRNSLVAWFKIYMAVEGGEPGSHTHKAKGGRPQKPLGWDDPVGFGRESPHRSKIFRNLADGLVRCCSPLRYAAKFATLHAPVENRSDAHAQSSRERALLMCCSLACSEKAPLQIHDLRPASFLESR